MRTLEGEVIRIEYTSCNVIGAFKMRCFPESMQEAERIKAGLEKLRHVRDVRIIVIKTEQLELFQEV